MSGIPLFGWLLTSARRSGRAARKTCSGGLRPFRFLPHLDALEDRLLLSTLTVLNNHDSGSGSLRNTIAAAPAGATIVFAPNLAGQTIKLATGELDLTRNLNIVGPGANQLTISGNDASRVFALSAGVTATLTDLTVAHGKAAAGGGIDNAGALTMSEVALANNNSVGGMGGGAIVNEVGANLLLNHSLLTDNRATAGLASDVFGGGLLNEGSATAIATTFQGNQAVGGSGSAFLGSQGGGIDNFGNASLVVTGSAFVNNQAVGAAGPFFGVGGAIENDAGFDFGFDNKPGSTATINNCTFNGNIATGGAGTSANGGAIDNEGLGTTVRVSNCVLTGNQAVGGSGGDGVAMLSQGLGGAIFNAFGACTVTKTTVSGNLARGGHGSTITSANPDTGGGVGGGILNAFGGTLTMSSSTLSGNQALGGATSAGPGGNGVGGGLANTFSLGTLPATATLIACTITSNLASAGQGGPGASSVPAGLGVGGGIDDSFFSNASLLACTVSGNQAIGGSPGSGNNGGNGLGGGISVGTNAVLGFPDASVLKVSVSTVDQNQAVGGTGGKAGNGGDGLGGGLAVFVGSSATVSLSQIEFNSALGGAAGAGGHDGHGIGGGVYNLGTFTFDILSAIKKNHASTGNNDIYP